MFITKKPAKKGSVYFALLIFFMDQYTKFWILENVGPGEIMEVFPCLNFVLTFNPGVTFGWLKAYSNIQYLLLVAGICILSCVVVVWWLRAENKIQRFATAMILAGAMGNLVDRIRFHAVVDFLDFYVASWHWYAFNVADSAIVLGVGLLFFENLYRPKSNFR